MGVGGKGGDSYTITQKDKYTRRLRTSKTRTLGKNTRTLKDYPAPQAFGHSPPPLFESSRREYGGGGRDSPPLGLRLARLLTILLARELARILARNGRGTEEENKRVRESESKRGALSRKLDSLKA